MTSEIIWDLGSFRDPEGSVFFKDNFVFRTLENSSADRMKDLLNTSFFKKYMEAGHVIETCILDNQLKQKSVSSPHLLKHKKISSIIYPYEWSFSMMKDAAILTLSLLQDCILNGFILKDGSAWNLTFFESKMCFFDVLSIGSYEEGQAWEGYGQFCQELLYPLFLKAYKDLEFQPLIKGSLKGVDQCLMSSLFGMMDWRLPGVFKHVFLNSILSKNKSVSKDTVRNKFNLPKKSLIYMVESLLSTVRNLKESRENSVWINYTKTNTYKDSDLEIKENFILNFLKKTKPESTLIDIGCNTGHFSRMAAKTHSMISVDIDSNCVDSLYQYLRTNSDLKIVPAVLDLMNPGPDCGWFLKERQSIFKRLKAEGFFSLALIHHLCIAQNVPIESFVLFLKNQGSRGVLEWVSKEDPMVQFLLRNRKDIFPNYHWEHLEICLSKYFKIKKTEKVNGGTRVLCWLEPK